MRIGSAATTVKCACAAAILIAVATMARAQAPLPLDTIRLPPGFTLELVARVPNARAMTWGGNGTLFVGSTGAGKVYAVSLPPAGTKGEARVTVVASGLAEPAGVAFRDGALYVSAIDRILRFDDIEQRLANPPRPVVVTDRFSGRAASRPQVHRVRPRWQVICKRRRAVQCLRARSHALREHHADESGWQRLRGLREGPAQFGRDSTGIRARASSGSP